MSCHPPGDLLTQGLNSHLLCLLYRRVVLYCWATWEARLPWSHNLQYIPYSPFYGCLFLFLLASGCQMLYFPYWTCLLSIPLWSRSCKRVVFFHNCIFRKQLAPRGPSISTCIVSRWHCVLLQAPQFGCPRPWYVPGRLKVSWTFDPPVLRAESLPRRSNQSILKEISPEYSLEEMMLNLQHFGHLMWRADSLEKTLMLGKIEGEERGGRGWDSWVALLTQRTWI